MKIDTNSLHPLDQKLYEAKSKQMLSLAEAELTFEKRNGVERIKNEISPYSPNDKEKAALALVRKHFTDGHVTIWRPRREFSDMSLIGRMQVDHMSFNTYQPNNGEPYPGDEINSWRSNAMRPVVRNRCISVAAHTTAMLVFPKVFAWNDENEEQKEAAQVMRDLVEFVGDKIDYSFLSLRAVVTALWSPATIVYKGYEEVLHPVKKGKKDDGSWDIQLEEDEIFSGHCADVVPVDELYIENFYEADIQKQGWLIWRRVRGFETVREIYGKNENFKYVKPGVQVLFNDANQTFYEVYDSTMRQNLCEEIVYYNRSKDLCLYVVNGVLMCDPENPNPRKDKKYPFAKFGFELLDEGRCFYYKSLAFKSQQDANIINSIYPMFIDGTYLSLIPPLVSRGPETVTSEVMVPGGVTTMQDPNSKVEPIMQGQYNIGAGLQALQVVENSLNENTPEKVFGMAGQKRPTAYAMASMQNETKVILGLFTDMIQSYVKQIGQLIVGDIVQYETIADAKKVMGNDKLFFKTFIVHKKGDKTKRIKFDDSMPESPITEKAKMDMSYGVLEEQGGIKSDSQLSKVQPYLFRNLKYIVHVSPDVLNPMTEEMERAFKLETYDRAIQNRYADQEQVTRDFLFGSMPSALQDPDKYMKKKEDIMSQTPMNVMPQPAQQPPQTSPMASVGAVTSSPMSKLAGGMLPK